ncbi:MAG: sensor histidine kinase [Lewinellaceae bacterium]|nr:sensor histidine kinase [Saprospiraceae bacterium]MCB9314682.1 sensor histidine kinase [Lewinellaceae bacterium]MCB9334193.1 sensor histidine kinase [Lewinellaceae bacterium]
MENIKRLEQTLPPITGKASRIRAGAFAFFMALAFLLPAQQGFEDRLTFKEIQDLLSEGIARRDIRKQALGWYKWAIYRESQTENRDSAFQYLARSVDLFLKANDTVAYHRARAELATRLSERSQADDALKMQQAALDYFRKKKNRRLETLVLAQMARVYQMQGDTARAIALRKEFREKGLLLKDTVLLINVFIDDIARFENEQNYTDALSLAFRVLQLADSSNRKEYIIWAQSTIGYLNEEIKDYRMALRFLRRAETSISSSFDPRRRDIYRHLSTVYVALDSLPQALNYAVRYMALADTLLNRDRLATAQRLAIQYREKERTREMENLTKAIETIEQSKLAQRQFFYVLLLFFGAIILALFFIVRDYRNRLYTNRVITLQNEKINRQTIQQLEDTLRIESMQSILEGQESERRRIATDLHDSLGGLLAAIKIRLENLTGKLPDLDKNEEFPKIKALLNDTIVETRQIAHNLQPSALHQFGLMKAIQDLTTRVRSDGVPAIDFQHFGSFKDIDHTISLNCYRIVQELLQNSLKHAKATEILVQLTRTDNELALLVEDNGTGYDPEVVAKGMGTDSLRQRVQFIKGEISIQTAKGQGTSTMVTVPLA